MMFVCSYRGGGGGGVIINLIAAHTSGRDVFTMWVCGWKNVSIWLMGYEHVVSRVWACGRQDGNVRWARLGEEGGTSRSSYCSGIYHPMHTNGGNVVT